MHTIQEVCDFLAEFAPPLLAEDWDNVGLLVGDATRPVERIMTCLTVTPTSAAEAVQESADLIVSHHPFPFRPFKQITSQTTVGKMLLQLIEAGIAVYSPHTAFDSARAGINQRLAEGLGLVDIQPLVPSTQAPELGAGRRGRLPQPKTLAALAEDVKALLKVEGLHLVGDPARTVQLPGVACGSAGSFLPAAHAAGCDLFVTGEASFHTCIEAQSLQIAMLLPGHFGSERFAVEELAGVLGRQYPELTVWVCRTERDPLRWR